MQQKQIHLIQMSIEEFEEIIDKKLTDSWQKIQFLSPSNSVDDFLTRNETAQMLRVTLPTLYDWTKRGYLQSYRMGSRIRYKRSEVNEAFDSGQLQKYGRVI
jgi:excisionase family DNA binding protein